MASAERGSNLQGLLAVWLANPGMTAAFDSNRQHPGRSRADYRQSLLSLFSDNFKTSFFNSSNSVRRLS